MLNPRTLRTLQLLLRQADTRVPAVFGALGDPNRFRIITLLLQRNQTLCVSDIAQILGVTVPAVSQHLRVLQRSGVVTATRLGQKTCYEVRRREPLVRPLLPLFLRHPIPR
ncbi:MAG: winged helix-turn-helix transcriptional regulator [Candidatus Kerfeldbacteria bacterium]|nr:winged helix-turn-helix transcriptional regulator [Candidatus Kerfeldbacteria bacterium]